MFILFICLFPAFMFRYTEMSQCISGDSETFSKWETNQRMEGHIIESYGPSGKIFCQRRCKLYSECRSVNFNIETLVCELNDEHSITVPMDLLPRDKYSFSDRIEMDLAYPGSKNCVSPTRYIPVANDEYVCVIFCPVGTQLVNQTCACPVGKYFSKKDRYGGHNCKACQTGYYQDSIGKSDCNPCPVGHYQNEEGATECEECPAGSYQDNQGQPLCKNCTVGYYQPNSGQSTCFPCTNGTFQSDTGQSACDPCPPGSFQENQGQDTCKECSPEFYAPDFGHIECLNCSSSTDFGDTNCTLN